MRYSLIRRYVWGGFVFCLLALTVAPVYATTLSSENFKVISKGGDIDGGTTFSSTNYSIISKTATEDSDDVVSGGSSQGSRRDTKLKKPDFSVLPEIILGTQQENIMPKNNVPSALRDEVLNELYIPGTIQNNKLNEVNTVKKDEGTNPQSASLISAWTTESLRELRERLGDIFKERSARALVLGVVIGGLFFIRRTKIGKVYTPF